MLHENALVFGQQEVRNFFMYNIKLVNHFFIQIFVLSDPKKLSLELGVPPVFVREKRSEIERFVVLFSSFLINADLLGDLFL